MDNKSAVFYSSKYGHTQKYAQWIGEELGIPVFEAARLKNECKKYDTIIFGGSIYAGSISGKKAIKENWETLKNKHIIVFTVSIGNPEQMDFDKIISSNFSEEQLGKITFFHLRGGVDYKKLSFIHSRMMSIMHSSLKKKPESELSEDDKVMLDKYGDTIDYTDNSSLSPLIEHTKNL